MNTKKFFTNALAMMLMAILVAPAAFFAAPQRASAQSSNGPGCVVGLSAGLSLVSANKALSVSTGDSPAGIAAVTSAGANVGNCLYNLIVVPVLRQMIRSMLQQMTRATINWVNGANGTGQPSFVRNLSVHLQGVGDAAALGFIARIATGFNSPFGPAISSSLQTKYNQQTSLAGFFATNQSTLARSSPNVNAFLAGNWAQGGGIPAWFALTTQTQNNPYMLYQAAESQVGSNVDQAVTNRRQDLIQGQGLLSYCGGNSTVSKMGVNNRGGAINPQVSCTDPTGRPVDAVTPGSTISSYLQANVNSGIGQLVSAQDLDAAIGQIVMALGNQVLGVTGLFGSSQPSSSSNTTPPASTPSSAATSAVSLAQTTLTNITTYTTAWQSIVAAANIASAGAESLATFCTAAADTAARTMLNAGVDTTQSGTQTIPATTDLSNVHSVFIDASRAQATAAQTAITTEILPVISQAQTAFSSASTTRAFALHVQAEAVAVPIADPTQFSADVAMLSTMPPASIDVVSAQTNASANGSAVANPVGSLTISSGALIDQMNLINTNAAALKTTVCNPNSSLYVIQNTGDGG